MPIYRSLLKCVFKNVSNLGMKCDRLSILLLLIVVRNVYMENIATFRLR